MNWRKILIAGAVALAPAVAWSAPLPASHDVARRRAVTPMPPYEGSNGGRAVSGRQVPMSNPASPGLSSSGSSIAPPEVATGVVSGQLVSVRDKVMRVSVSGKPIALDAQALDFQSQLHDGDQVRAAYEVRNGQMQATKIWRVTPSGNEVVASPPQSPPEGMFMQPQ